MRFYSVLFAATVFASSPAVAPNKSAAASMPNLTAVHCGHFVGTAWARSDHTAGKTYGLVLFNERITGKIPCPQAIVWATKLMATQHSANGDVLPVEVKGGPAGYHCFLTPDGTGHWVGGTCQIRDSSGNPLTSFDWLPVTN